ncbi:unnamed protein product [Candidula unifasciata]|uniref:Uncharacterized protein n=1 Tax=Candidula unifasciata TaxID=100452 RepID=A0A8S3YPV1_9EUPU|nr:unnamed protein product [Candidula unifasciata]
MMDYLQVYAKEAIGSVSDNLAKIQQSSGIHIESHLDKAEVIRSNTLHRSGTFVLKETCAAKPPNIARRRDTSVSLASASSAKPYAFVKEVEEDGDKSEESQNVPHPSPTFLVTEDKIIADTSTKMPEHSLTKSKRHDADSSRSRKKRKTQQTMKGPSCLISDQDFDNESSDSLSEAKESRNLTYTSSLLTQLLDYNSADESKTNTEESKSNKLPESTCSELVDSASENLKQQRAATFKHSKILKDNAASKKALASNVLFKSRWMSLNDDGDNVQAADQKPDLDKDGTNVDIPCENPLSESLKNVPKHIHVQEMDNQVQHETRTKTTQASRKQCLADITVLSRVPDIKRINSGAIPKVVSGSSHHEVISPSGSHPTGKSRSVYKPLLETCQDEDVTNKTMCPTEKEHVVSKQPPRRSPKQYFLGQHSHKQWHQPTEDADDVPGNRKQDMLLAKLDWSSSDDEAVDDVPRDVSPSFLLRQKQKRDVDDQLEHLNQYYSRSRKSRSPLRRTATSNISRWIEDVQGSSTEYMHVEAPDFFADTFPQPFRHKCQVLSGNSDDDAITPENYEKHANSDYAVFVSPSQLLEARNQEENNATENLELNEKVNELAENPDSVLRATMFKDDQRETRSREEGSKRSWSVSSTSDEYILSDTRSIQVNVSRNDLVLDAPEEVKPDLENYELAQTSANKLFTYSRVETCAPKASLAVGDSSSFTVLIKQGNIIERTFKDQAAPDLSFDNQAIQTIKMVSGSIDDDCLPDEPEVADCLPLNAFPSTVKSNEDCLYHYKREVSTGHTLRESEVMSAVGANPTGNGVNHGALRNSRNNKCFKDVSQVENVSAEDGTEQTSENQTLGKEFNKRLKNSGPAYCDAVLGETYSEETTDISTIRERWKLLENGGNVVMAIGPEGKQNSKKCTQKLPGLSADSSITIKTHSENLMSQSTGKNDVPEERATDVKTNFPDASSPYTLTDEDEHTKRQVGGDLLTEYQAIDALRYKVNRLEQMLQQSDINTVNFYQRNTRVHSEEPVKTSETVTICPHCPVSASTYNSLTRRQFQPPPEHRLGSHPYCLASTDQHLLQQTQSYNVGQVCLTGHASCVHQQRESLYVDTKLLKPSDNKSSKGCQTSGDLSLDKPQQKNEVCVDACTQSNTLEDASEECLISLEKQVANMQTDMQEIKHFTTSTSTLVMELDERTKSFAAITSTQLAAYCRLLEDSQTAISAKLEHMEQNLHDQSNLSRLIKEYITRAEKNSETVMETVRAEHQVTIARTAQTVKEVISPMQESLLNQQKEFENIRSSLEEVVSMLNDKRPEPSKKGMNHESMKERIVELTSQRDAEKVFHRITRQALRALEKDHDRLRQEYVRATCRRYNTNESEAQKRLWYYLNNEDKCPHNKNHSNVRSTRRQHEVWSPRSSSADDDASSSCCMHESCPYAHVCQKECLQQQRPGYVVEDDIREFTSRKKDNSTRCKSTQLVKCAGNVGTCLARSVEGHRGGEDRHNLAVMHNDKSPKTSKVLQTSRFVEQDLELKHTRKDVNCRTPTIITGNQLDKNADASTEDIACKCSCSDKKNRTKSHS